MKQRSENTTAPHKCSDRQYQFNGTLCIKKPWAGALTRNISSKNHEGVSRQMSSLIYGRSFRLDLRRGLLMKEDGPSIYKFLFNSIIIAIIPGFIPKEIPISLALLTEGSIVLSPRRCNLINFDCEKNGTTINFIQLRRQLEISFQFYLNKRYTKITSSGKKVSAFVFSGHKGKHNIDGL